MTTRGIFMFSSEAIRALILSFGAGLSTLLGALLIFFSKAKSERTVTASLGFAAGVMISVSFTDMLPNATASLAQAAGDVWSVALSVALLVAGVLLAALLDNFAPHATRSQQGKTHSDLYRVGMVSMLAIGLHNFPEGIATFMAGYEDAALGVSIAVAIALHNIPEGISVAMPVYYATGSRAKAFKFALLSGVAEPLGALLAFLVLRPFITPLLMGCLFAIVAGIMLYISIEELIPSSRQYGYTRLALVATFAGICLMPLTHVIG